MRIVFAALVVVVFVEDEDDDDDEQAAMARGPRSTNVAAAICRLHLIDERSLNSSHGEARHVARRRSHRCRHSTISLV
jgi:hypothetical protein